MLQASNTDQDRCTGCVGQAASLRLGLTDCPPSTPVTTAAPPCPILPLPGLLEACPGAYIGKNQWPSPRVGRGRVRWQKQGLGVGGRLQAAGAEQRLQRHNQTKGYSGLELASHTRVCTHAWLTHTPTHTTAIHVQSPASQDHPTSQIQPRAHCLCCCFISFTCMHVGARTHTCTTPHQGLHIMISHWTQLVHLALTSHSFLCPEPDPSLGPTPRVC